MSAKHPTKNTTAQKMKNRPTTFQAIAWVLSFVLFPATIIRIPITRKIDGNMNSRYIIGGFYKLPVLKAVRDRQGR